MERPGVRADGGLRRRRILGDRLALEGRLHGERKVAREERERQEGNQDASFFVKNLENVQGDEREVMIFSTTFGKQWTGGGVVAIYSYTNASQLACTSRSFCLEEARSPRANAA